MGKFCEICGKGVKYGNNVSHSERKTSRTWAPNTHKIRVTEGGTQKRVTACTRCIRTKNKNGEWKINPKLALAK